MFGTSADHKPAITQLDMPTLHHATKVAQQCMLITLHSKYIPF